jgi:hypothetical protein
MLLLPEEDYIQVAYRGDDGTHQDIPENNLSSKPISEWD